MLFQAMVMYREFATCDVFRYDNFVKKHAGVKSCHCFEAGKKISKVLSVQTPHVAARQHIRLKFGTVLLSDILPVRLQGLFQVAKWPHQHCFCI